MTAHRIDFRGTPALDPRLSPFERTVLTAVDRWPGVQLGFDDIGMPTLSHIDTAGPRPTLDLLVTDGASAQLRNVKPQVFLAVARLEEFGYLPVGAVR